MSTNCKVYCRTDSSNRSREIAIAPTAYFLRLVGPTAIPSSQNKEGLLKESIGETRRFHNCAPSIRLFGGILSFNAIMVWSAVYHG